MYEELKTIIERTWEDRTLLGSTESQEAIRRAVELVDKGLLRWEQGRKAKLYYPTVVREDAVVSMAYSPQFTGSFPVTNWKNFQNRNVAGS